MGVLLNPGCCETDCGGEGERGKRGKRGHRGHEGPPGPAGPSGIIDHVEVTSSFTALPEGVGTTVLVAPVIQAPAGAYYQFTGMVTYNCTGSSTSDSPPASIQLVQDAGTPDELGLVTVAVTAGARQRDVATFDFFATVPIAWWRIADGLAHVYSVRIITDFTGDGGKQAQSCALFVNVIPAP